MATHSMETVTISGTDYSAFVKQSTIGDDLMMGGFSKEDFHQVAIPRANITVIPSEGDPVTFRSQTFVIAKLTRDDAEALIVLDLAPPTSRRLT